MPIRGAALRQHLRGVGSARGWAGAAGTPGPPSPRGVAGAGRAGAQAARGAGRSRQGGQAWAIGTRKRTCSRQGRGSHPGRLSPAGKPPAGEAGEGSAGVCSGRNRASIDLLLLKPELLSGTPAWLPSRTLPGKGCPACPRRRGTVPPKHLAVALAHAGMGWQPGRPPQGREPGSRLAPTSLPSGSQPPAAPGPPQLARHPRRCPRGSGWPRHPTAGAGGREGTVALTAPFLCWAEEGLLERQSHRFQRGMNQPCQEFCPGAFL